MQNLLMFVTHAQESKVVDHPGASFLLILYT